MNIETELNSIISKLWDIQDIANSPRLEEKIKGIISDCQEAIRIRKDDIDMHSEDYWKGAISQSRKSIKSDRVLDDYHNKEIYRQAFASLIEDTQPDEQYPGSYRVLVDGCFETNFSANSREEAIQKFKDYFVNKKKGINNSKKPIKSFRDTSNKDTSNDYGFYWDGDNIYDKDGFHWYFGDYINNDDDPGIGPYSSYMQAVKETEDSIRDSFTEDEIPDPEDYAYQLTDFAVETLPDPGKYIKEYEGFVKSSRKSIKSSLDDVLAEYRRYGNYKPGSYLEQLISTMYNLLPEDGKSKVDDFIHGDWDPLEGKMVPRNNVQPSTIKSSLEDRLVPYLEEFEEGYANAITRDSEEASEFEHVYEDTFFEQFKSDYNLTDTDIQKLDRAVREIWDASSTEEGEVRDMGEMYGAPRGATPEEALKVFESKKPIESALRVVHREDKTFTAKDGTEYHLTLKREEGKARRRGGWQDVAYTTVNCSEFPETEWFPYSEGKSASFSTSNETTKPNFWDVDNVATAMIRDYKGWSSGETDKTISEIMSSKKIRCSRGR